MAALMLRLFLPGLQIRASRAKSMKKLYYRWLLSYLPVFFSIISVLVFIFFLAVSGYSRQQVTQANAVFSQHVMQTMDAFLRQTEQIVVHQLLTDEKFALFYDPFQQMTAYETYELVKKIKNLATVSNSIDSVYLYRYFDHRVLTTKVMTTLEQFADRAFMEQDRTLAHVWSGRRVYGKLDGGQSAEGIVTLVKPVPLMTGNQGLIVINVRTSIIGEVFNELSSSDISFMRLMDAQQQLIYGESYPDGQELSRIQSDYTGWTIVSGVKSKRVFGIFSALSTIWLYMGGLAVAAGTVWLVFITRRNYKPVESIRDIILQFALTKKMELNGTASPNDFAFIKNAIENLMEQSNQYEEKYKENLIFRRKWLFQQTMEGDNAHAPDDWRLEIQKLGLPEQFDQLTVAVLEIDRYDVFRQTYSHSDQQLLKFVLTGVAQEVAESHHIQVWSEWVGEAKAGLLFFSKGGADGGYQRVVGEMCGHIRSWVEKNLQFTVTFGIGGTVRRVQDISPAYDDALQALQYKTTLGGNRTICYRDIEQLPQGQMFRNMDEIRLLVQHYKLGEEGWDEHLGRLMAGLRSAVLPRSDIVSLMNYVIYSLQREMAGLPAEIRKLWDQSAPALHQVLQEFEDMEELERRLRAILGDAAGRIGRLREHRSNYKLIHEVREYIESHFANPDLSLEHLSSEFHLNVKRLSRLFKEEFGEKFVDYLATVRIGHAKQLLKESAVEPIQDVARKVGFYNMFTFIRVFKKVAGMTPGEYRKTSK